MSPLAQDPQRIAADPGVSAFVTANAGSGKTKTLIDRVARLLLAGSRPETILCLTYTKAAAAEMQRRLFARLGDWSVRSDAELRRDLADLEGRPAESYGERELSAARGLFASALETPGGLKIQTIHAFCEKLLRRFPLEAGVSPAFQVMDDAQSTAVAREARERIADYVTSTQGLLAEAFSRLSVALDFQRFEEMFQTFESRRGALQAYFERVGDLEGARQAVYLECGVPDVSTTADGVRAEALAHLDLELWRACAELLLLGGAQDRKNAARMAALAASPQPDFQTAADVLLTQKGEAAKWLEKTAALKGREELRRAMLAQQDILARATQKLRAVAIAEDTVHVLALGMAYLHTYATAKAASGLLDFSDLVDSARRLLRTRPQAAWVLYKLDAGLEHILLDEAQDTAPEQWEIVQALTGEFFSGETASDAQRPRTLFIVGDEKQSIYSFQGAAPERLRSETDAYMSRITGAGAEARHAPLVASWRSTQEILGFVDAVFEPEGTRTAVPPPPGADRVVHEARRLGHQGCVDLWPLFEEEPAQDRRAWDAPLDELAQESAVRRLARAVAAEVTALVARGDAVEERGELRPARYGDVLILVRKRGALFDEVLRALKQAQAPVAGADRLTLSSHIAFDDLMAIARFVLFPQDELTLAALLRSPLCEIDDESLFDLAYARRQGLWETLDLRRQERPEWAWAHDQLSQVLELSREHSPFGFYSAVLALPDRRGTSLRARAMRRLGPEAKEAMEEFLGRTLQAEQRGVCDLQSLVADFADLEIVIKRELELGRNEVRVMTTHGAKGLEAPIVFLPETTRQGAPRGSPLLETETGGFLWCASKEADCPASASARALRELRGEEEDMRLLYVALTRARDRLVLAGRLGGRQKAGSAPGWINLIQQAFDGGLVGPHARQVRAAGMDILRYGADPVVLGAGDDLQARPQVTAAPAWTKAAAPSSPHLRYASPATLGEAASAPSPSPLAEIGGVGRFRRGDLIHRLLQALPDIDPPARRNAAWSLLERERDLTTAQIREMANAALGVLEDDRFAAVFGPSSRAEVAIAGSAPELPEGLRISGRIDRLVVLPDRVLVADFKTARPAPRTIEDADPAYVRQMAVYAAVLREIFPGRKVETALVWTDGPRLMWVPEKLMAESLTQLRQGG